MTRKKETDTLGRRGKCAVTSLALLFAANALPAQELPARKDAAPDKPEYDPRGLWKSDQYEIVTEIKDCPPPKKDALCSYVYWAQDKGMTAQALGILASPREKPASHNDTITSDLLPLSTYCGQTISSSIRKAGPNRWEGMLDPHTVDKRDGKFSVTMPTENTTRGEIHVKMGIFSTTRQSSAVRISPDDKRYPRCKP